MSDLHPTPYRPFLARVAIHPAPWLAGRATEIAVARLTDMGESSYEEVWLAEEGPSLKVANIPFFLYGIAPADLVTEWQWVTDDLGRHVRVVTRVLRRNGVDVYRLILLQPESARATISNLSADVPELGVEWSSGNYAAIAVECGPRSERVRDCLTKADAEGAMKFEKATAEGLTSF